MRLPRPIYALVGVALVAVLVGALAGCGGGSSSTSESSSSESTGTDTTASEKSSSEPVHLALFVPATSSPYYQAVEEASKEQASKEDASETTLNPNYDPQQQASECQSAIVSGEYQAFVVYPVEGSAIVPCAEAALKAKIPVVATGGPIGSDWNSLKPQVKDITGQIFPVADTSGKRLAELTEQACEDADPCQVLYEIGNPAFAYDASLLAAFKKYLPENAEIVQEVQTNFNPDDGRTQTANALEANPGINVIVTEDGTARGTIPAVDAAGKSASVKVIGSGGSVYGTEQVKKGTMFGTIPFVPRQSARLATEIAIKAARGETLPQKRFEDEANLTPVELITKETAGEWTPEYE